MTLNGNLILALTLAGSAAVAAVLAVRRRERRLEAAALHESDLQRWESDGGSPVPSAILKPPA